MTSRTLHSLLLLRPGPVLNEIIIGALARAQAKYPLRIVAFFFLSSHFHILVDVESSLVLSRFMAHFKSKLAKEVGRVTGWREKIFGRRYTAIYVSAEDAGSAWTPMRVEVST